MPDASGDTKVNALEDDRGRLARRLAEAEAVDDIVLRITSSLDLNSTLQSIVDAAAALSGAQSSSLYLRSPDGSFRAMACYGLPLERLQQVVLTPSDGLISQMVKTGEPAQATDFAREVRTTAEAREEVTRTGVHATLGVPLMQRSEVVGALYVGRVQSGSFSPDTVRTLERLAAFARVALHNAQQFSSVEEERGRLQRYFDAIPEGVVVFDRDTRVVLVNESLRRELRLEETPVAGLLRVDFLRLVQEGKRQVTFRYDTDAVFQRVLATGKTEQTLLELVDPPATFEVHFSALRRSAHDVDGVVATMRDLAVSLDLARERTRAHLLAQLLHLSAQLNSDLSVPSLVELVVESAIDLVGAQTGALGQVEGERIVFHRFRDRDGWKDLEVSFSAGEGVAGHVWEAAAPYLSNNCRQDPHLGTELQRALKCHRLVAVPMVDRAGRFVGALEVHDPMVERDFGQLDVEALQLLAHQAAVSIENARLRQLKDEFLSVVSHELKTPVTSIKGFAQVLQRQLSPESLERGSRYLKVINEQADRLTALINDLLDLTRIQTGRFVFERSEVDYSQLVRDVVSEMQLLTSDHRIHLSVPDRIVVQSNANRLRQVLVNLIDNAVTHGPRGGTVEVLVKLRDGQVHTCVVDEGEGLPPDEATRVFDPYYQVRHGGGRHPLGLGLGLFISRQIVEEHEGSIWLETGPGTRFCFTLPVESGRSVSERR